MTAKFVPEHAEVRAYMTWCMLNGQEPVKDRAIISAFIQGMRYAKSKPAFKPETLRSEQWR